MNRFAKYLLQIGLAITFFVIGMMILQDPEGWGALIQPWALKLVPGSVVDAMRQTAYVDMGLGILFLIGPVAWIAALVGSVHIVIVLVTVGVNTITIRDIGLLAATIALCIETTPASLVRRLMFWKKS